VARSITSRLRHWQKKLLLSDWKISVEVGALDDGSRADCDARPEYKEAKIRLDPDKIPLDELDGFLVHELLHCHTWRLEQIAEEWGQSESRYAFVRDVAEAVVTDLERIVLNVARR
jgi:hypothetical protein